MLLENRCPLFRRKLPPASRHGLIPVLGVTVGLGGGSQLRMQVPEPKADRSLQFTSTKDQE